MVDRRSASERLKAVVAGTGGVPGLGDVIDTATMQSAMEDFYRLTRIPMALIDLQGIVIVGAGWQDVCTRFHRIHPETCSFCVESDTELTADIPAGEMRLYRCRNGMWDAATPILVGDLKVGNLFTGQFFFEDEPPDLDFFRDQAARYGFPEQEYLTAVTSVPMLSRDTVEVGLRFLTTLSSMISQMGFATLERARAEQALRVALDVQTRLADQVSAESVVLEAVMENTDTHLAYLDADFVFRAVNSAYARGSGHTREELVGRKHFDLFPNEENQEIFETVRRTGKPARFRAKPFRFADQPWRGTTYWDWSLTPVKGPDGAVTGFAFSLQDVTRAVRDRTFSGALNQLNDLVHSTLDPDSIIDDSVRALTSATGCEVVTVALRSESGQWRYARAFGLPEWTVGGVLEDGDLPAEVASLESGTLVIAGAEDGGMPVSGVPGSLGIRSMLVAPLAVAGVRLGAIAAGFLTGPAEFDERVLDFAGKLSASLSLALHNSQLFHEMQHAAQLSEALAKVNEILLSTLAIDEVLARLVGEASVAAGADKCLVIEVSGDSYTITHVRGTPDDLVGRARTAAFFPGFALTVSLKRPVLIGDAWHDPRTNKDFVVPHDLRAFQLLPLRTHGVITHVLALGYDTPRDFDAEDERSAERMAAAMSAALGNARLYENEHRIADRLQEALLALPEAITGIEFAQEYRSATEAARVGGDFFDIFQLDGNRVGITIGDVAGKGLDAAVLTSLAKNTIRAHAMERDKTPGVVLSLTNEVVFRATAAESFVTVFFGVLDCHSGDLVFSSGAHTTAALVDAAGELHALSPTGPLLGAFPDVRFREASARLEVGDVLLLYTDGVTEARRDSEHYGEARLFGLLSALGPVSVSEVVRAATADVLSFTGDRLRDDVAILAVSRTGVSCDE